MRNARAHKIQWSGSTVHFYTVVGSKWILGGGGCNSRNLGGSGGRHPQMILKSRTLEIRFPAFWKVMFYRKALYKLEVWERVD